MTNSALKSLLERKFFPYVSKPMRYTGAELNMIRKDPASVLLHGVLCFPDLYDIGMSHFGIQILYNIINSMPQWALSRCFHPWGDAEKLMRELGIPLYTLEYTSAVKEADWIGFSVQYELQFTNVLNMLDLAGLPIYSRERVEKEGPLVIAGGPCIANPEPLAEFVDAFVLGDGEETIVALCTILEQEKKAGTSKRQILKILSELPGVYVPSQYEISKQNLYMVPVGSIKVTAAKVTSLLDAFYPEKPLVPLTEVVHSRLSVEVMRGCTRGCRFCSAGYFYRPVRERKPDAICATISKGVAASGWRDVGLLSLSTADYSCLSGLLQIVRALKEKQHLSMALPSTRIDALSEGQLDLLEKVTATSSLTIAPEAGNDRLRRVINKNFTDEEVYQTAEILLSRNVQTLKLYFMIGLPTEQSQDTDSIITMVSRIAGMARAASRRKMVHVAVSPFSPKAHTPFQWEQMEPVSVLEKKGALIKRSLRHLKNVKVSYRDPHITELETIMARGDRSIGDLVHKAWSKGARFDGWDECFDIRRWYDAAEELSLDLIPYLSAIPEDQNLPWSLVSTGIAERFLKEERSCAVREEVTPDCRLGNCTGCGVCRDQLTNRLESNETECSGSTIAVNAKEEGNSHGAFYYRVIYQKGNNLRFLGHLDMVGIFHRAFSIAGIPLAYSQGFNPHPRISFGPPLPFGVAGEREAFDLVTTTPLQEELLRSNQWLPEELRILQYSKLTGKEPSLNSTIKAARYRFQPAMPISSGDLEGRITQLLSAAEIIITVEKKSEIREKNIRPGILELKYYGDGFEALLSLEGGTTCKPSELSGVLYPDLCFSDFLVTRTSCVFIIDDTRVSL